MAPPLGFTLSGLGLISYSAQLTHQQVLIKASVPSSKLRRQKQRLHLFQIDQYRQH